MALFGSVEKLHASVRKPLRARNDKLKNALLLAIGKKWISK
jgi:hypothetical protein